MICRKPGFFCLLLTLAMVWLIPAARAQFGTTTRPAPTSPALTAEGPAPDNIVVTDIRVSRRQVRPGGVIYVSMRLRNQGVAVARSYGAPGSRVFGQSEAFDTNGRDLPDDRFSIVMTVSGPRGDTWPWRWGIGGDLPLNRIRRVRYPIRLTRPGTYTIFVGVAVGDEIGRIPTPRLTGIKVVASGRPLPSSPNVIRTTPPTRITVNNEAVALDQPPILADARLLVPIRFVLEHLGAYVQWNRQSRTVTATRGTFHTTLNVGKEYQQANGERVFLYVPPRIVRGRTMVPIRFVTEALGGTVNWNARTKTVEITVPKLAGSS